MESHAVLDMIFYFTVILISTEMYCTRLETSMKFHESRAVSYAHHCLSKAQLGTWLLVGAQ